MGETILVSGGAGYIGSHAAYVLRQAGFNPVVIDNLVTGHEWACKYGTLEKGDVGDAVFVRAVCERHKPVAAMHFAAFIEVGESVQNPDKYFENNRDKASRFFTALNECGVRRAVFSSTAAVYGQGGDGHIDETQALKPINPYGQSKLEAENFLRSLVNVNSVCLRYFNVAGAAPEAGLGEAHKPESHLIPRLILSLLSIEGAAEVPLPPAGGVRGGPKVDVLRDSLELDISRQAANYGPTPFPSRKGGRGVPFTIYGDDYPTPDGTAIRDYVHVMDLCDAHLKALDYLLQGGGTDVFNIGNGEGYSVREIVEAAKKTLDLPDFKPQIAPRRAGDSAVLVASSAKAKKILGWQPVRSLDDIIQDAAAWHRSERYINAMRKNGH